MDALPMLIHASIARGIRKTIQHNIFKMIIVFTHEARRSLNMVMDYCPICSRKLTYSFENQIERWYCDNCHKYFDGGGRKITP